MTTMKYNPNDAAPPLLTEGWYDATILQAEEKISKAENPMIDATFRVFGGPSPVLLHVYFVANKQASLSRLKKLCGVVGVDFDAGEVQPDQLVGHDIAVHVKTQEDKTGQYPDKNVIAYFAERGNTNAVAGNEPDDDDCPF